MPHQKATPSCSNRLFEWMAALTTLGLGIYVPVSYLMHANADTSRNAFIAFEGVGLSIPVLGIVFAFLGVARMIALRLNGDWILGPHVRIACAVLGMFLWSQLLYGVFEVYETHGNLFISTPAWMSLFVGEYISLKRAILDVRHPDKEPDYSSSC